MRGILVTCTPVAIEHVCVKDQNQGKAFACATKKSRVKGERTSCRGERDALGSKLWCNSEVAKWPGENLFHLKGDIKPKSYARVRGIFIIISHAREVFVAILENKSPNNLHI